MSGPLLVVLPVFGFIALGYVSVAARLVPAAAGDGLAAFVFTIALPLLLFRALGTLALPDVSPWAFWAAYFAGVVVNIIIGIVVTRGLFGRDAKAGVIGGMSAAYGNLVMVGTPLIEEAFGDPGLVVILMLVAIHLPIMMVISAFLIETAEAEEPRLGATIARVARELVKNPLIIGILAGLAFRMTGLPLTGPVRSVVDGIAGTATPLALVCLGMTLNRYGIRGNVAPGFVLGLAKLVLMPVVVYLVAVPLLDLPTLVAAVAVVSAACPTGANAFLIASRFNTGHALAANTITLTTLGSLATLTAALFLFHA